jgi:hypothetical protein
MSHPKDRRHRFLIGKKKGENRGYKYFEVKDVDERERLVEVAAYKCRNTTKLCSCEMCCNPRRGVVKNKDKLTIQEKRFFESLE